MCMFTRFSQFKVIYVATNHDRSYLWTIFLDCNQDQTIPTMGKRSVTVKEYEEEPGSWWVAMRLHRLSLLCRTSYGELI